MDNLWERLRKRLGDEIEPHGALAAYVRRTGFSRSAVENWRDGRAIPGIDKLEKIAISLNIPPSALLDPGSPAIPPDRKDVVDAILRASPSKVSAIRTLLLGSALEKERSAVQEIEESPDKNQKRGK